VLGPGHRWAHVLAPVYWIAALMPSMRDGAQRLGLVTLRQMIGALAHAVDTAGVESTIVSVTDIRRM
jgi:hypothetical protein